MSSAGHILLAANPLNLELLGASLALFGLILLGAIALIWADRWRKRTAQDEPVPPETAQDYRALYDKGVMSKEEYDRIRAHLEEKLRPAPPPALDAPSGAPEAPPTAHNGQGGVASG